MTQEQKEKKFIEICDYARNNTLYYKNTVPEYVGQKFVDYYNSIPALSKLDFRVDFDSLLSIGYKGDFLDVKTTGSTGVPTMSRWGKDEYAQSTLEVWKQRRKMGAKLGDTVFYFLGLDDGTKSYVDRIGRNEYEVKRVYSKEAISDILNVINGEKRAIIYGSPSTIYNISLQMEKYDMVATSVIMIELNGELCSEYEERTIKKVWNVPIMDNYGARETWPIAFRCQYGKFHVSDNIYISDDEGELLVTSLIKKCQPLIKYKLGDIGKVSWTSCQCGCASQIIEDLIGRKNDYIYLNEREKIHWAILSRPIESYILNDTRNVVEYYVKQKKDFSIDIFLVLNDAEKCNDEIYNVKAICEKVIGNNNIHISIVDSIEQNARGKKRCFESEIKL